MNEGGLLEISSVVNNTGGTIDVAPGTGFSDVLFSQIQGGVVRLDGGTLGLEGYVTDVTFEGAVTLGGTQQQVDFDNAAFAGLDGTSPGTLFVTGPSAEATFGPIFLNDAPSQTLDNATIFIGNAAGAPDELAYEGTITLGPHLIIDAVGTAGLSQLTGYGTLINQGTIIVGGDGDVLAAPNTTGTFVNQGTIDLETGGTFAVTVHGTIGGLGDILLDGGVLELLGTVLNSGSILDVAPGGLLGDAILGGTIAGGTVSDGGGTLTYAGGTLAGVTTIGTLDLATRTSTLTVTGGVTVQGTAGGDGVIAITGTGSTLVVGDTETLNGVLIHIGNASTFDGPEAMLLADAGLTLGATATLVDDVAGGKAALQFAAYNGTIVNAGTIVVSGSGASLLLAPLDYNAAYPPSSPDFANTGTVVIGPDATFNLFDNANLASLGSIVNAGTLELGGSYTNAGVYTVTAGATLLLDGAFTGGTIDATGGAVQLANADLTNVIVTAPTVTITAAASGITFAGTTALDAPGGGPTALVTDAGFGDISLGANYTLDDILLTYATTGLSTALIPGAYESATLGSAATFDVAGAGNALYLVGQFDIVQQSDFDPGTIVNHGTILVGAGAELVDEVTSFSNLGTIALAPGSNFDLGFYSALGPTDLGTVIGSGATFALGGTDDLGGGTFDLSAISTFSNLHLSGTLADGTLLEQGGTFTPIVGAVLANMTVERAGDHDRRRAHRRAVHPGRRDVQLRQPHGECRHRPCRRQRHACPVQRHVDGILGRRHPRAGPVGAWRRQHHQHADL